MWLSFKIRISGNFITLDTSNLHVGQAVAIFPRIDGTQMKISHGKNIRSELLVEYPERTAQYASFEYKFIFKKK